MEVLVPKTRGRLDALQHRALDLRLFQYGFHDQIAVGDRLGKAVGRAQVRVNPIGRSSLEKALGLQVLGLASASRRSQSR
jgi:hypothetical protein